MIDMGAESNRTNRTNDVETMQDKYNRNNRIGEGGGPDVGGEDGEGKG
jgi:hypothetical protein